MFPVPYSVVILGLTGRPAQRWTVPRVDAHQFAADMVADCWSPMLGDYRGSQRITDADGTTGVRDAFDSGYVFVGD